MMFHLLAFVFATTIVYFTASTAFASGFMTMIIVHVSLIMMFTSRHCLDDDYVRLDLSGTSSSPPGQSLFPSQI